MACQNQRLFFSLVLLVIYNWQVETAEEEVFFNPIFRKFEYKYSFKGPYLSQPHGEIPFWQKRGNALASDMSARLTSSLRNQKGALWVKNKTEFEWWEVKLMFRVSGRGRMGGEGMAFWFMEDRPGEADGNNNPEYTGGVYGGPDYTWKGLGVIWDTHDSDGKDDNPAVLIVNNDGQLAFDYMHDGENQTLGRCVKPYRNTIYPLQARIRYYKNTLSVLFNKGWHENMDENVDSCFEMANVILPEFGYFGISASTWVMADDHDIYKFLTYSLREVDVLNNVTDPEVVKYEKEFGEMEAKYEHQKEEYMKEHPDEENIEHDIHHKNIHYIEEEEAEQDEEFVKDIKEVLREQYLTHVGLLEELKKVAKIWQIQYAINTNAMEKLNGTAPELSSTTPQSIQSGSGFQRFEVENILTSNTELLRTISDIKHLLHEIDEKVAKAEAGKLLVQLPGQIIPGIMPDTNLESLVSEIDGELLAIRSDVLDIGKYVIHQTECQMCISAKNYVAFSVTSTLVILFYLIYKDRKAARALKDSTRFY